MTDERSNDDDGLTTLHFVERKLFVFSFSRGRSVDDVRRYYGDPSLTPPTHRPHVTHHRTGGARQRVFNHNSVIVLIPSAT